MEYDIEFFEDVHGEKLIKIRAHLLKFREIDARTMIYKYNYFNTTDAISKLPKDGMNIESVRKPNTNGGSHVLYKLVVNENQEQLKLF